MNAQRNPPPDHDRGLAYDVRTLLSRRRALGLGGAGLLALAGCSTASSTGTTSSSSTGSSSSASPSGSTSTDSSDLEEVPDETAGPYPADGSDAHDVLTQSGIVRQDIRSSVGTGSATAEGIPLTLNLTVLNSEKSNAAYDGAAVYLWHCDREGRYSMYSEGLENENYLRGVQECDEHGAVRFTTVFPACYSGRWPHLHFEVYSSVDVATSSGPIVKTSQIALPESVCSTVYATDGYEQSVRTMAATSLSSDMVFRDDGGIRQLATVTGSTAEGYTAALTVAA